jgi:hypothetical protein
MIVGLELEDRGIADEPVDPSALQRVVDDFRRIRGLFEATQMRRWLTNHGLTQELLERLLENQVRAEKLRDQVTLGDLASYYDENRTEFDVAIASVAEFSSLDHAQTFLNLCKQEPSYAALESFLVKHFLRYSIERWRRFECPMDYRQRLFSPTATGPHLLRLANAFVVVQLISFTSHSTSVEFDEETRQAVRNRLFQRWLERKRQQAYIEWDGLSSIPQPYD